MAKHRRAAPLIPVPKRFPPPLEHQRAMIEESILDFRAKGYRCELNIEAFQVQDAGDGEMREKEIEKLQHQMENCYKSARLLQEKLDRMPKPKAPPKGKE